MNRSKIDLISYQKLNMPSVSKTKQGGNVPLIGIAAMNGKQLREQVGRSLPQYPVKTIDQLKKGHADIARKLDNLINQSIDGFKKTNELYSIIDDFNKAYDDGLRDTYARSSKSNVYYIKRDSNGELQKEGHTPFARLCEYIGRPLQPGNGKKAVKKVQYIGVLSPLENLWSLENGHFVRDDALVDNKKAITMRSYIARRYAESKNAANKR